MRRCCDTFSLIERRTPNAGVAVTSLTMTDELLIDRTDGVATVTLNRPDSMNSLSTGLKETLVDELDGLSRDATVRAVVLTGAGRGFCVGQDLREHVAALDAGDPAPLSTVVAHYNPIVRSLATMPKPVIAAVNGMAAGAGAGFAFACDIRIASTKAGFLIAFANVGLSLDSGVSWTLPRLVGGARATALCLLAEPITADAALEMGLVSAVVEPERLLPAAQELAARLAAGPTAAYAAIRESLAFGATATLDETLEREAQLQTEMGATEDHRNATAAFVAKQKPVFTGR